MDINYHMHTYVILFLTFRNISAAGRPRACYQSVPCLTVNCILLQRGHGSWPSDNRHPGHRSSCLPVQVKFLPYWPASVAAMHASQWRMPGGRKHSVFSDRCCFIL